MRYYITHERIDDASALQPTIQSVGSGDLEQIVFGLNLSEQAGEIIVPDDALELKAGAVVRAPLLVRFNPADRRQSDYDPISDFEHPGAIGKKAVRGKVDHAHGELTQAAVLGDRSPIYRVTARAALFVKVWG